MKARRARECLLVMATLAGAASGFVCSARAQNTGPAEKSLTGIESETQGLLREPLGGPDRRSVTFVDERLSDGKLFFKLHDYVRASIALSDVVDNYPQHPAVPEAMFWLGESLHGMGDSLGARARFRQLIARAHEPAARPFVADALGRLIEIAINTRDFDGVESYFQHLGSLPAAEVEVAAAYFRAKYLYNQAVPTEDVTRGGTELQTGSVDTSGLNAARTAFERVALTSPFNPRARYFVGVIHTLQGQFPAAIQSFRGVLSAKVDSPDQRQLVDLTHLALGRLLYETQQLPPAVEAYRAVPSTSPWFDTALYEVAWVYLRMGDSTQAERALQELSTKAPGSPHLADGNILRGNLLVRNGRRPEATSVFKAAVARYAPLRQRLDAVMVEHADTQAYFRGLVRDNIQVFDASTMLPPDAVRFASEDADFQRALAAMANLSQTRALLDDTVRLMRRLDGSIHAPNAVNSFPDLKGERERTVGMRNRTAKVIMMLIGLEERRTPGNAGDLGTLRGERRQLEREIAKLPTTRADFRNHDKSLLDRYGALASVLYELEAYILDPRLGLTALDRSELSREIDELQLEVEAGRMRVGVGDPRYLAEDELRRRYIGLVDRERGMLLAMGVRADPTVDAMFGRASAVEASLDARDRAIDQVLTERVAVMNQALAAEASNLAGYQQQLAALEGEAEVVVGTVANSTFETVRRRVYDLVLRADLGIVDVSWVEREDYRKQVETLTRGRADEMRALDAEFQDIMDEPMSGGQQ